MQKTMRVREGDNTGKYINLEFAYLKEDVNPRYVFQKGYNEAEPGY